MWTEIDWPDETRGPWRIEVGWEVLGGRWEAVALNVSPSGYAPLAPLRAVDVRGLRLGEIVERSRPQLLDEVDREGALASVPSTLQRLDRQTADNPWRSDAERAEAVERAATLEPAVREAAETLAALEGVKPPRAKPGRPALYGPEHWAEVAAIYRDAHIHGLRPTRAVAEKWHVERSTAAKWVARCRDEFGLLGKTEKRKAGGIEPPEPKEDE